MNFVRILLVLAVLVGLGGAGWFFFFKDRGETNTPSVRDLRPPDDGRFRWGVQVRPNALNRYSEELMAEQLDLAKELGVSWIRLDWHNYNDFAWHDRIVDMAAERGLHVVLILEDIGAPTDSPNFVSNARTRSKEIAQHYKGKIRYFQLFNEVSGTLLKGPSQPGTDFTRDYDQAEYAKIRDWLKAAGAGIKEANPDAKLAISGQWTHTAVFEQLIKDGVSFDILGWNWFDDMGDDLNAPIIAETAHQKITLLDKLRGFGKELWITELNTRPGANGQDEAKQAAYINEVAERIYEYQAFKGLFVFELMDQAEVGSKGGANEYYGIVKFAKDSSGDWVIGEKQQTFEAYRQVITKLNR